MKRRNGTVHRRNGFNADFANWRSKHMYIGLGGLILLIIILVIVF